MGLAASRRPNNGRPNSRSGTMRKVPTNPSTSSRKSAAYASARAIRPSRTVAAWRDIVHSGDQPLRALWLLTATTTGAGVPRNGGHSGIFSVFLARDHEGEDHDGP